ncbi:MAG: hypothetical protein ACE5H0_11580 [Bacteroidota bacterium]
MSDLTMVLISASGFLLILAFDVWLSITKRQTITEWIRKHSTVTHWIAFVMGFLMAHFFGTF